MGLDNNVSRHSRARKGLLLSQSSAPCLHNVGKANQCYKNVVKGTGYCIAHQPEPFKWNVYGEGLPKNWQQIKRQVLTRDKGMCYKCLEAGREARGADGVEHIIPRNEGGADAPFNLKAIHHNVPPYCHRAKTSEDAHRAKAMLKPKPRNGR